MSVRIYSDIPMPARGPKVKYAWERLEIGQCFKLKSRANGQALCDAANNRYKPKKFKSHVVDGVTHVWRIA